MSGFSLKPYDPDNIFARILRGDLPSAKIFENDETYAFLDVMPQIRGHALVIPKAPSTCLLDVDAKDLAAVMATIRFITPPLMRAVEAEGFVIRQFNGEAAKQTVFHFHVHILPRREGDTLKGHISEFANSDELAADAERIRAEIAHAH